MAGNFINNDGANNLRARISQLVGFSQELKFLVGFFYFSGLTELYQALKNNPQVAVKVLVGLNVDKQAYGLVEYADPAKKDGSEHWQALALSLVGAFENDEFDNPEFYEQAQFFIEAVISNRLVIRKTREPNHAKLYLFKIKHALRELTPSALITGSSNLTRAGLSEQDEFNVEIKDYGFEEAETFFDGLWDKAIRITENDINRRALLDLLSRKTLLAPVTPYEAYVYVLKTYLESQQSKTVAGYLLKLLGDAGYRAYRYQLDAVSQALQLIEQHNGVIIADVVGLGKSIIAGLVARSLDRRGLIICPPGLIGDQHGLDSGWQKYKRDFGLLSWEICSCGDLERARQLVEHEGNFEVVIVDEAHRFRNQGTQDYDLLHTICRNKMVILLSATPFNNTPSDIFAMLKLFVTPGRSDLTLEGNLEGEFRHYNSLFRRLSYIKKYHNSANHLHHKNAIQYFEDIFGSRDIDLKKVTERTRELAARIKTTIAQVTIRRNRIDLENDPVYSQEKYELSRVADPRECFFVLTPEQSSFYDRVIKQYFGDGGRFTGAIYRPYIYEVGHQQDLDKMDEEGNFRAYSQTNLFDFMRRLLVKRFESSFGAFRDSIRSFLSVTQKAQQLITTSGKYVLDRRLLNRIYDLDGDEINQALAEFEAQLDQALNPKQDRVYQIKDFTDKDQFLADIQADIELFKLILAELESYKLVEQDPKLRRLVEEIAAVMQLRDTHSEPTRKVVVFSEYVDTIRYVAPHLEALYPGRVISVKGDYGKEKAAAILANFDSTSRNRRDDCQILITTDKMSEGFNLNRAGVVINYDIPWNPTRVIQRVGRINRISKKVFEQLYICNFFPTVQGADIIKSREIATQKMFLIHNTLGEDAKIFEPDEEPTASALYNRIQQNPEAGESETLNTTLRRIYQAVPEEVKQKAADFSTRLKAVKAHSVANQVVFIRKGSVLFARLMPDGSDKPVEASFTEALAQAECVPETPALPLTRFDWEAYRTIKEHTTSLGGSAAGQNRLEQAAYNNLRTILNDKQGGYEQVMPFVITLIEDMNDYRTLTEFKLRRLSRLDTANPAQRPRVLAELESLRCELGDDYLEKIKKRAARTDKTVIVAVQNVAEATA